MNQLEESAPSDLSPADQDLCRRILELSRTTQLTPTARTRILSLLTPSATSTDPTPALNICLTA